MCVCRYIYCLQVNDTQVRQDPMRDERMWGTYAKVQERSPLFITISPSRWLWYIAAHVCMNTLRNNSMIKWQNRNLKCINWKKFNYHIRIYICLYTYTNCYHWNVRKFNIPILSRLTSKILGWKSTHLHSHGLSCRFIHYYNIIPTDMMIA